MRHVVLLAAVVLGGHVAHAQEARPRFHYELEFGSVFARNLDIQAPPDRGTELALGDQEKEATVTAIVTVDVNVAERHGFEFFVAPLELRDFEPLDEEIRFGGEIFPPSRENVGRFLYYEYAARYRYDLVRSERFVFKLGGSLLVTDLVATVAQPDVRAEVSELDVRPMAYTQASLKFARRVWAVVEAEGLRFSNGARRLMVSARLHVQWNRRWNFGFGYRTLSQRLRTNDIRTKFDYDLLGLVIGFSS